MICDDCKYKSKCNKIISEGEKYCRDKRTEDTLFRIDKDGLGTVYVRYEKVQSGFRRFFERL